MSVRFCYTCGGPLDEPDRIDIVEALVAKGDMNLARTLMRDWWDTPPQRLRALVPLP